MGKRGRIETRALSEAVTELAKGAIDSINRGK
jgi:hypothetical protein